MKNASKLNEKELVPVKVYNAPDEIAKLFTGRAFPVIAEGKLCLATYEREIDGLFINKELSKDEVLHLAVKEAENIYADAVKEAGLTVTKMLCKIYEELNQISPPWDE